jgi:hypothetical protein
MDDTRTWALVENLSNLDQMETTRREIASKSSQMATRYRLISTIFFSHAEESIDPVRKCLDLVEAKNFMRLAEMEEAFAARGHQDLAQIALLKRETLALLERPES